MVIPKLDNLSRLAKSLHVSGYLYMWYHGYMLPSSNMLDKHYSNRKAGQGQGKQTKTKGMPTIHGIREDY